jgi:hypothetical protein
MIFKLIAHRKAQDGIETACTNRNFKTPSMILIKSTLNKLSVCKVLFIPKIAVPIRLLDSLKNFCAYIG